MTKEIERFLREDIREKKKAASGSFHKRGKGVKHGFSGALRTPSYYMSNKEKNQLNGELKVSNMYKEIISKEEFFEKDLETQKLLLTKWRELYQNKEISDKMGMVGVGAFHKLCERLKVPKKPRIYNPDSRTKKRTSKPVKSIKKVPELVTPTLSNINLSPQKEVIQQPPLKLLQTGLHLEYSGNYDSEQLSKIFTKLQLITDDENCKFMINISLTEST